ncbi:MAG TPA: hypothetical protein VMU78_09470 [Methylocella sp.]|nr:hypothetical protein [Methylocella sp.]
MTLKKKLLTFCDPTLEGLSMKTLLLTTCMFGALIAASAAPSLAANLPEVELSQANGCQASCRANADACRAQCSDPEEQTQCVVECDRSACLGKCNKFEAACKQHCPSPGG